MQLQVFSVKLDRASRQEFIQQPLTAITSSRNSSLNRSLEEGLVERPPWRTSIATCKSSLDALDSFTVGYCKPPLATVKTSFTRLPVKNGDYFAWNIS